MTGIRHMTGFTLPGGMAAASRLAVIGDVHGRPELLAEAMLSISHPWTTDLVLLGDLIGRGPKSRGCLELVSLVERSGYFRSLTVLPGNHEAMLHLALAEGHGAWRNVFMADGGEALLSEFAGDEAAALAALPSSLRRCLAGEEPVWLKNGDLLLVHAGLDPAADPADFLGRDLAAMRDYEAFREEAHPLSIRGRFLDPARAPLPFTAPDGPCIVVHGHSRIGPREPGEISSSILAAAKAYRLPLDTSNCGLMAVLEVEGRSAVVKLVSI